MADFEHEARWNETEACVEKHLRATRDVTFTAASRPFRIPAGETIHTENSKKYGSSEAHLLLRAGGWTPIKEWVDDHGQFALVLAEVTPHRLDQ